MTHINDPSQSPGAGPGGDDDPMRLEAEFAADLGEALAAFGGGPKDAGFREELRQAFVTGAIDGEIDEAAVLGSELDRALRGVPAEAPRAGFRAAVLESFLAATPGEAASDGGSAPAVIEPAPRRAAPRASGPRRAGARRGAPRGRQGGGPGLRLLAGGGLLAAAAAAAFIVLQGGGEGPEVPGDGPAIPAVADAGPSWRVDLGHVDAEPAAVLASLKLDGEVPASMEEFAAALATGRRVETTSHGVRLCCEDDFVIELAEATVLDLAHGEGEAFVASAGSVRVATGPGFDPVAGMILETPHVRTMVAGTIFGVDVNVDYTCVCCLEGEVRTEPVSELLASRDLGNRMTRVVQARPGGPDYSGPLVPSHRGPLEALRDYWG